MANIWRATASVLDLDSARSEDRIVFVSLGRKRTSIESSLKSLTSPVRMRPIDWWKIESVLVPRLLACRRFTLPTEKKTFWFRSSHVLIEDKLNDSICWRNVRVMKMKNGKKVEKRIEIHVINEHQPCTRAQSNAKEMAGEGKETATEAAAAAAGAASARKSSRPMLSACTNVLFLSLFTFCFVVSVSTEKKKNKEMKYMCIN